MHLNSINYQNETDNCMNRNFWRLFQLLTPARDQHENIGLNKFYHFIRIIIDTFHIKILLMVSVHNKNILNEKKNQYKKEFSIQTKRGFQLHSLTQEGRVGSFNFYKFEYASFKYFKYFLD